MPNDNLNFHKLARYYRKHKEGTLLGNEPASLLCEYLDSRLTPEPDAPWEAAIEALLSDTDFERLGEDGSLGGVRVTMGKQLSFAHYGHGDQFQPLTASQLLELAEAAEISNEPAPLPDWDDEAWSRSPSEFEPEIERLSFQAAVKILAEHNVPLRLYNGIPTFCVNGVWLDNEKWALTELVSPLPEYKRQEILKSG